VCPSEAFFLRFFYLTNHGPVGGGGEPTNFNVCDNTSTLF